MNTSNDRWTIGIIISSIILDDNHIIDSSNEFLSKQIESIHNLKIPIENYEIILIGETNYGLNAQYDNIRIINFKENDKSTWITKKKNIIFDEAKFENIIVLHDYIVFDSDWYEGFQQFSKEWDVCMVKIFNKDGIRWRDWVLVCGGEAPYKLEHNGITLWKNRLSYDDTQFTNTEMYISGSVIIGKRSFLVNNKLNENYGWCEGEDIEWSERCRGTWVYKMNTNSSLHTLKQKEPY